MCLPVKQVARVVVLVLTPLLLALKEFQVKETKAALEGRLQAHQSTLPVAVVAVLVLLEGLLVQCHLVGPAVVMAVLGLLLLFLEL
jgi:hypothetical protein